MERRRIGRPPDPDPGRWDAHTYKIIHATTDGATRTELAALVGVTPDKMYVILKRLHTQGKIAPPSHNRVSGRWTAAKPPATP